MNFRKSNFIIQIICYLFLSIFCFESIKAKEIINKQILQNNIEEKLKLPDLQEDFYLLGSGDSIIFSVIGAPELSTNARILNDGNAIIPFLGPVKLSGLTVSSASKHLENLLSNPLDY